MGLTRTLFALLMGGMLSNLSAFEPATQTPAWGVPASPQELATRDNLVFPDGNGLPAGRGTVAMGEKVYVTHCIACHGAEGRGGSGGELAGGNPDLTAAQPDKTIGTYWPFAPTLFDFIRRAMPLHAPWSLRTDEIYALCAYLLHLNRVVAVDFVASQESLATLKMPNWQGFQPVDAPYSWSRAPLKPRQ